MCWPIPSNPLFFNPPPKGNSMSLEAVIQENTDTMKALIAALTATGNAAASSAAVPKPDAAKTAAAASGSTTAKAGAAGAPANTAGESDPSAASAAAGAQASTAAGEPITYDVVSKAITDGVKTDRAKVVAALAKFGAKKGTELKVEQYADFLVALA
jgi:hypothetical protein